MRPAVPVRAAAGLLVLVLLALMGGCSSAPAPDIGVSLFQNRADYAPRIMEVELTNHSTEDVVITGATFTSSFFAAPGKAGHLPYTLVAGTTTDFPAKIPAPVCTGSSSKPSVTISLKTKDGTHHTVTTTPTVPFDSLGTLHAQDCGQQAFERVATITPAASLRFEVRGGVEIALLDLQIRPTGSAGSVTLISTTGTTLLIPVEGEVRPLGLTFTSASPPTTLTLDFVPSRCGTHVISEDKVGTLIPFHAKAGTFADAYFRVAVSPVVKGQFYDWVGRYCAE